MDPPALSIVVVAYRQVELLLECLEACSAAASKVAGRAELIVVDNGGLAPLVRERCPPARLVEPGRNMGFAAGVTLGIAAARGRWIALVNDDARIEPNSLAALLAAGDGAECVGSVAAQVRFAGKSKIINSAGIAVDRLGIATERFAGAPVAAASGPAEVFGPTACFALYRRSMLTEIGGFDGRFSAYLEDVDVAWRARAAGWTCLYEPQAVAHHRGSASYGPASAAKYFLVGRNRVWLLARNATTAQLLRALPSIALYDSAYVVYVALTDGTLAPLRGRIAGLREWRSRRREADHHRRAVELEPGGWRAALRQHRAYRSLPA